MGTDETRAEVTTRIRYDTAAAPPPPPQTPEDVYTAYLAAAVALLEAQRGLSKWLRCRALELGEPRFAGGMSDACERQIVVASQAARDLSHAWRQLVGEHSELGERMVLGLERRH